MALFITLGLISRPSAKMLSLAQHPDYAQHLSVYAVSCTVPIEIEIKGQLRTNFTIHLFVLHNRKWAYLDFSDFDV
jgi:hypothetical protein